MGCKSTWLPLLMDRVRVRRIKTTIYIPLIPTFSLKGEGAGTCVDTYAPAGRGLGRGHSKKRNSQQFCSLGGLGAYAYMYDI